METLTNEEVLKSIQALSYALHDYYIIIKAHAERIEELEQKVVMLEELAMNSQGR